MAYKPCKHLDVPDGKRITKNDAFFCRWRFPKIAMPVSITEDFRFRDPSWAWRRYVSKDDCARCPCFESRKDPSGGGNQ